MKKKIVLTGATGLLGSHILSCIGEKNSVWATSRKKECPQLPSLADVEWIQTDLHSGWEEFPTTADAVIHLAQSPYHHDLPGKGVELFDTNAAATLKLLEWARNSGVRRFIFASTGTVYQPCQHAVTETSPTREEMTSPKDLYWYTKLVSEKLVQSYRSFFSIGICRYFFIYGENQRSDMLLARLMQSVEQEKPIFIQGEKGLVLNPIHAQDAARATLSFLSSDQEMINVAGGNQVALQELVEMIGRQQQKKPVFTHVQGKAPVMLASIDKMQQIHQSPLLSLEQGLQKTADKEVLCRV